MGVPVKTTPTPSPQPGLRIGGKLLARNTAVNIAGQVIPLLVGVITMSYVIRHLGPDRFGLLSLAWMVVGYFALLDFGIGPATTKFVAELLGKGEIERLPALVWTALATQTIFGCVAGVLFAAASPTLADRLLKIPLQLRTEAHWVFLILAVSLPIGFATGTFQGVLAASQRFDLVNAVGIPTVVLYYVIPAGVLALGFGLRSIVFLLVVSRMVALGGYFFLSMRLYPVLRGAVRIHRSLIRPLLGFGGWVTVSGAINPILAYFDRFLMGALMSIAAIGFYTPPFMIATKLGILPGSLAAALFPAFSTSAGRGDNDWIRTALVRSLKYLLILAGLAAIVLIFFARPILTLWVGAKFAAEGSVALQILAVGAVINSLALVPYNLLQGVGRPDLTAKFHLLEVPIHIGFTWFLVTRMGLPGAALAWSARVSLDFLLLMIAACRVTQTSPRVLVARDLRRSATTLAALALSFAVMWGFSHALLTQTLISFLLVAVFSLTAWRFALDSEERWKIRLWLNIARVTGPPAAPGRAEVS
jgi:O-antigen/teichoic acid export membrane protein